MKARRKLFSIPNDWDWTPEQKRRRELLNDLHVEMDRQIGRILVEHHQDDRRRRLGPELAEGEVESGSVDFERRQ
jgi:hypothetical protein